MREVAVPTARVAEVVEWIVDDAIGRLSVDLTPEWTVKYDDVLTPELRRELAFWRAATGMPADERTLAGSVPHDTRRRRTTATSPAGSTPATAGP